MGVVFSEKDSVFFVGGRGTKAGNDNAGGCTMDYWGDLWSPNKLLSDVMGTNGEPVSDSSTWGGSQTACTVSDNGSGFVRITKTGCFGSCEVGHVANVSFAAPISIYNGRYEVTAVNANYIDIDMGAETGTCDVNVGGAFAKLQTALDNTTADAALTPFDVFILTNKDETFTGAGDRIDIDSGGGDALDGKWKRIIGIDDDGIELAVGSYVTIDGDSNACHVFYLYNITNIQLRHIWAKDAGSNYYDFGIVATTASKGYSLKDCKTTGGKYGVYVANWNAYMVDIEGGYYSSSSGTAIHIYQARYINLLKVELVGTTSLPLVYGYVAGTLNIDGCLLRKTANFNAGIISNYPITFSIIKNCVFYNIDDCIQLNDNDTKLIQHDNIFILHTAASGKIINRMKGSILYSDYSCAWAVDGAPALSGRWGGTGLPRYSIEQDPLFFDAANLDFRIKMTSPCKRTGNPTLGKI